MADAYAKATQRTDAGQRAFRARAHQCADRHRRGRQEPHAAAGAGGRRADRRGEVELLHRAGRDGARRSAPWPSASTRRPRAREDTLRAVTRALRDRQTVVLSLPTDVQDAPLRRQRRAAGAAAGARPAASRSRERPARWRMRSRARSGRSSLPGAAP